MATWDEDRGNPSGYNVTGGNEKTVKLDIKGLKKVVIGYIGRLKGEIEKSGANVRRTRWDMKNDIMTEDRSTSLLEADERDRKSAEIIRLIGNVEAVTVGQIINIIRSAEGYEGLSEEGTILLINALRVGNKIPISALEPRQTFDGTGDRHGPSM